MIRSQHIEEIMIHIVKTNYKNFKENETQYEELAKVLREYNNTLIEAKDLKDRQIHLLEKENELLKLKSEPKKKRFLFF